MTDLVIGAALIVVICTAAFWFNAKFVAPLGGVNYAAIVFVTFQFLHGRLILAPTLWHGEGLRLVRR